MRDEMLNAGYIWENNLWTSPYTGRVTSFQPAREEYMIVRQLGGLVDNSPMNWAHQINALNARIKRLAEKSTKLVAENRRLTNALQAIQNNSWSTADPKEVLEVIRDMATKALSPEAQAPKDAAELPWIALDASMALEP